MFFKRGGTAEARKTGQLLLWGGVADVAVDGPELTQTDGCNIAPCEFIIPNIDLNAVVRISVLVDNEVIPNCLNINNQISDIAVPSTKTSKTSQHQQQEKKSSRFGYGERGRED